MSLLNNAGFGHLGWLEDLDPVHDIQAQLQVNLVAVIQMAREVLPHMIERRSGHIINMASVAGLVASPTYSVYAASKFGMRGFSEALRREVGVFGIHVSALYPGGVRTEFKEHTGAQRKTGSNHTCLAPPGARRGCQGSIKAWSNILGGSRYSPGSATFLYGRTRYFPGWQTGCSSGNLLGQSEVFSRWIQDEGLIQTQRSWRDHCTITSSLSPSAFLNREINSELAPCDLKVVEFHMGDGIIAIFQGFFFQLVD